MAALKAKALPVGSVQWIQNEREQAEEFISQDLEEFSFSVRNEMEWLNEHMADVFSKNQVYVQIICIDAFSRAHVLTAIATSWMCSRRPENCEARLQAQLENAMLWQLGSRLPTSSPRAHQLHHLR